MKLLCGKCEEKGSYKILEEGVVKCSKCNSINYVSNQSYISKPKLKEECCNEEHEPEAIPTKSLKISHGDMDVRSYSNIQEIPGFNYTDYLAKIILRVNKDKFEQLRALTEADFENGLLSKNEIEKLRVILKDGFKENMTISQIEKNVRDNIDLKDRLKDGKIVGLAANRPINITRTEVVRLSNEGLIDLYKENKVERVRFLAALSSRTCPTCEGLNSQIFNIDESRGIIPVHSMCRCSWIGVTE